MTTRQLTIAIAQEVVGILRGTDFFTTKLYLGGAAVELIHLGRYYAFEVRGGSQLYVEWQTAVGTHRANRTVELADPELIDKLADFCRDN